MATVHANLTLHLDFQVQLIFLEDRLSPITPLPKIPETFHCSSGVVEADFREEDGMLEETWDNDIMGLAVVVALDESMAVGGGQIYPVPILKEHTLVKIVSTWTLAIIPMKYGMILPEKKGTLQPIELQNMTKDILPDITKCLSMGYNLIRLIQLNQASSIKGIG